MYQDFAYRHNGPRDFQVKEMLDSIGVESLDELNSQTVPADIRLDKPLNLAPAVSEAEYLTSLKEIAAKNKPFRSMIGMGFYGTASPSVIIRNIFENPSWYTSYTPYQSEISQGRLEALIVFQTMISSLTGFPLSNCSMLDDATAAAEAMRMMFNLRSRSMVQSGYDKLFVDEDIFPQVLSVLQTRANPLGIHVVTGDFRKVNLSDRFFGAIVQYPAADGEIRDYSEFCAAAHSNDVLVTAYCDLLALTLIKEPAAWGADVAVGSA
ncbi:MAG: hypothetical protein J6P50_06575 [Bacteroidales bacterium]|nr:hypothetical protein [Bacteroidales bacterium]